MLKKEAARTFSSSFLLQDILLKETQENRHPYYLVRLQDGYLVYTYSVACMALSLSQYNFSPSLHMTYNLDLLVAGSLLHAVGTIRMHTPSPDARRRENSIPLNMHELTVLHIQEAVCKMGEDAPGESSLGLLFHMIGCVYESERRKPLIREALILKSAVCLHEKIALLEHFIYKNKDKSGILYDDDLGNYIYEDMKGIKRREDLLGIFHLVQEKDPAEFYSLHADHYASALQMFQHLFYSLISLMLHMAPETASKGTGEDFGSLPGLFTLPELHAVCTSIAAHQKRWQAGSYTKNDFFDLAREMILCRS